MTQNEQPPQQQQTYTLSKYRYINLFIFLVACFANGLPAQAFTSLSSQIQQQFHYSKSVVALNVLLGPIMHPLMATPANLILDKFGIRVGCSIGSVIVVLGVWSRTLIQVDNPVWALLGSTLCAIGNVFALSSPALFAIKWFEKESVPKITSLLVLMNMLSTGLGGSFGGMVVPSGSGADKIQAFFRLQAIIVTVPIILFLILFKQKPKNPPSKAALVAESKQNNKKQPYIKTIKQLATNKSYVKIVIAMSFSYGIFLSFLSILDQSLSTLGYQKPGLITSISLGSAILTGSASAFMFAFAARVTLKYKSIILLCQLGMILNFILLTIAYSLKIQSLAAIAFLGAAAGFFVIPLTALFTTYSTELTFPAAQGSATGYLFAGSQTIGFVSGISWIQFIDSTNKWKIYFIFGIHVLFLIASFFINLFTDEHLNKTKFQESQNAKAEDADSFAESLISNQEQKSI